MVDQTEARGGARLQQAILTLLRIAVGWHFLYEGIDKALSPGWTSGGYLEVSRWVFGSVAEKVLRHAPCPVLALRTAGRPAQ